MADRREAGNGASRGRAVVDVGPDDRLLRLEANKVIAGTSDTAGFGPADVAAELGIGLRRLHRLFEAEPLSVADSIRSTRLQHVALALSDPKNVDSLAMVAEEYGFGGVDQCARAFKRRYGHSMREHRLLRRA